MSRNVSAISFSALVTAHPRAKRELLSFWNLEAEAARSFLVSLSWVLRKSRYASMPLTKRMMPCLVGSGQEERSGRFRRGEGIIIGNRFLS